MRPPVIAGLFAASIGSAATLAQKEVKPPETFFATAEVMGKDTGASAYITIYLEKYTEERDRKSFAERVQECDGSRSGIGRNHQREDQTKLASARDKLIESEAQPPEAEQRHPQQERGNRNVLPQAPFGQRRQQRNVCDRQKSTPALDHGLTSFPISAWRRRSVSVSITTTVTMISNKIAETSA